MWIMGKTSSAHASGLLRLSLKRTSTSIVFLGTNVTDGLG
jgi:hypothetical protein